MRRGCNEEGCGKVGTVLLVADFGNYSKVHFLYCDSCAKAILEREPGLKMVERFPDKVEPA